MNDATERLTGKLEKLIFVCDRMHIILTQDD